MRMWVLQLAYFKFFRSFKKNENHTANLRQKVPLILARNSRSNLKCSITTISLYEGAHQEKNSEKGFNI